MDAESLEIETVISGRRVTLRVAGELDASTASQLDDAIRAVSGEGATDVVVDFTTLAFIDSSGLSVLIAGHKRLAASNVSFTIVGAQPSVRRVFAIAGLDRVLTITE